MNFDLAAISQSDTDKLLVGIVVPPPIALMTVDRVRRDNAAPFSIAGSKDAKQ